LRVWREAPTSQPCGPTASASEAEMVILPRECG
jgi:hypothetical protein